MEWHPYLCIEEILCRLRLQIDPESTMHGEMTPEQQLETLQKRVAQFPGNELFRFSLGKTFFDAGDYSSAIEHFEVALAKKPDWMLVAILMGRSWKERGDLEKARQYLRIGQELARIQHHDDPLEETTRLLEELG